MYDPSPRLSLQTLDSICRHLESVISTEFQLPPPFYRAELENFIREEETKLLRNNDANDTRYAHEVKMLSRVQESLPLFRNVLEKKKREVQMVEQNWQRFQSLEKNFKLQQLDKLKSGINSAAQNQSMNFFANIPKEVFLQQLTLMQGLVENDVFQLDLARFPSMHREFKSFSISLSKLITSFFPGDAQSGQRPALQSNARPDEATRIYNNTNIILNLPNSSFQPLGGNTPINITTGRNIVTTQAKKPSVDVPPGNLSVGLQLGPQMKKEPSVVYDDSFWTRMINLAENPSLNDGFIKENVKQKKMEKRRSDIQLKEPEPLGVKKVKQDNPFAGSLGGGKAFVVVVSRTTGIVGFVETFKEVLCKFEEKFKENLIKTMEKTRVLGFAFTVRKALVDNGISIKLSIEQKPEYGFLKLLAYPNTIAINDCKILKELEICFQNSEPIQDLGNVLNKWQNFSEYRLKSQK